ncbi:hypothetical protein [Pseudochryseolinea flava]|uniref:hypothetical protein n=1 Tax=Pseudochryseolinea flava TaxID=2059302 RepID=UPI00105789BF|nr:hypothetical protein [Pseudochryseolinea flava]
MSKVLPSGISRTIQSLHKSIIDDRKRLLLPRNSDSADERHRSESISMMINTMLHMIVSM